MIRKDYLLQLVKDHLIEQMQAEKKVIMSTIKQPEETFFQAWAIFLKQISDQQNQGKKGEIALFTISYLRTQITQGLWGYRLDAYDEREFLDDVESSYLWSPDFIFQYVEKDITAIQAKIRNNYQVKKVVDYEWQWLKILLSDYYHQFVQQYCANCIGQVLALPSFQTIKTATRCQVFCGEYLDQMMLIDLRIKEQDPS